MATGTQRRKGTGTSGKDRKVLIREYACRLVSRFIYSEKALYGKITGRFPEDGFIAGSVIEELKGIGFIDDKKNARYFAELLKDRGYGPKYIKSYLFRKGFHGQEIPDYYNGREGMEKWFLKKTAGRKVSDKKEWVKIFNYLKSKGFYTEEVLEFLRTRGLYERE